jgi:HAD superfamily hydrolase (TIGR01509 family)
MTRDIAAVPIAAVLFDLSGTVLDESYIAAGMRSLGMTLAKRYGLDPEYIKSRMTAAFREVSAEYLSDAFYLMGDVFAASFERFVEQAGFVPADGEGIELTEQLWRSCVPHAVATEGAVETLTALRSAGIKTGIVSYADTDVFRALLDRTGLAGLTDIELCSEQARSCKPHPGSFLQALASLDTSPANALYVGDNIEHDVVGANRAGMRSAHLAGREFSVSTDTGTRGDAESTPTYTIHRLTEVLDLVLQ